MIKLKLHKNLLYLLILFILNVLRIADSYSISFIFEFKLILLLNYMASLGKIIGGLIIYVYQIMTWRKKEKVKYFGIKLIYKRNKIKANDSIIKIILLIFFSSFYGNIQNYFSYMIERKMNDIPSNLIFRLSSISLISSSLICFYALKYKIGKHHKFSLIALSICLSISIISDILFKPKEISFSRLAIALFYIFVSFIFDSFTDCIEKYLVDFNFLNPFNILMVEGIFEFIMEIIYSYNKQPFKDLIRLYEENEIGKLIILIIILIIYILFSSGVSVYKIYCNAIYSPMAKSLMNYLFSPLLNIINFMIKRDFYQNYYYLIESIIISLFIDFFACIFLEYIVIYCCGLDYDTKIEISSRSLNKEMNPENYIFDDDEDEDDNMNINASKSREMSMINLNDD